MSLKEKNNSIISEPPSIIKVEGISKRYRLGIADEKADTFALHLLKESPYGLESGMSLLSNILKSPYKVSSSNILKFFRKDGFKNIPDMTCGGAQYIPFKEPENNSFL